uniref:RNase H type-1 domain-containing protein n=1 Tax=Molossus molossus TaxID=27622 RepID=A0A7J8HI95_MOLMO|nr:hypothetical protein HJG59_010998 [Molossus molossus]
MACLPQSNSSYCTPSKGSRQVNSRARVSFICTPCGRSLPLKCSRVLDVKHPSHPALLLDQPPFKIHRMLAINPASLLPDDDPREPLHDCLEIIDIVQTARLDLKDVPLLLSGEVLFRDGSSYIQEGIRYGGAAVVTLGHVIWSQSLYRGTLAQRAELIAPIQSLHWGKDKPITIYTNSSYAFATVHVHSAIYCKRGLLTSAGKDIKIWKQFLPY